MQTKRYLYLLTGLLLAILVVFAACSKAEYENQTQESAYTAETGSKTEMAVWNKVCPVCGDEVDPDLETVTHDGKVYGFGCAGCPEKFGKDPENFVKNLSEDGSKFIGS